MNIFYLDEEVKKCAQYHCDSHVVKMITEYSQMLSTAHRYLDGTMQEDRSSGRLKKKWIIKDPNLSNLLMEAAHVNHPSTRWVRSNIKYYNYLRILLKKLLDEYDYRYGKDGKYKRSREIIKLSPPKNISKAICLPVSKTIPLAMPIKYQQDNRVEAYREFYRKDKTTLLKWTKRDKPDWI